MPTVADFASVTGTFAARAGRNPATAPAASGGAHPVQFAAECHLPPVVVSDHARTPMLYAPAACVVIVATSAFQPSSSVTSA